MIVTTIQGQPCPDYIQAIMTSPAALRARAKIRVLMAAQDLEIGDTEAYERNIAEAGRLLEAASAKEEF